ncbi:cellulose synthase [Nonomuraea sp. NPDC046570]|uniref:cellulose synthase n=1 Tax=Nonomuraea sp. NPDC046570 TaxID=3155255 RepID=UPI0033E221F0
MGFEQIAWLPLCAGVTAVGLVFSFLAMRRRGVASGLRLAAWSLLPTAAYLTGAIGALWTIGATAVGFVTNLVLNPLVWAGVAVAGLSAVLFVVSGVMRSRKLAGGSPAKQAPAKEAGKARPKPAVAAQAKPAAKDDDFGDIEDILKRRGIS